MDLLKLGIVPLAALMAGCAGKAKKGENRPNIIVIMADDLGYGDVSCYGAEEIQTPGIDRLAEEGLRLTNGHCTSATSTPSRFAMLTGMYPWRVGASILPGDAPMLIKEDMPTFPKMLKQAGYATGVVGKWHLGLGNGNRHLSVLCIKSVAVSKVNGQKKCQQFIKVSSIFHNSVF